MRLLALDLGTIAACVIREDRKPLIVAEWDCSVQRGESNGMRILRFRKHLAEAIATRTDFVFYEDPGGTIRNAVAARVLLALVGEIEAACAERDIQYKGFNPSTIKRAATGKGGGKGTDKPAMLAATRARWPELEVSSEHVADALWVMEVALREIGA